MNDESAQTESAGRAAEPEATAEKISIKCTFDCFEKAQIELVKNVKIFSIIGIVVGALLLVAYIVIGTIFEEEPVYNNVFLFTGAIVLVVGIMCFVITRQGIKTAKQNADVKNEYEFFSDCFVVKSNKIGDEIGMSKIYWSSVGRVKETESFLFLYIPMRKVAFAVPKSSLSHKEYDTIMRRLSKKPKYNEGTIELSECGKTE